MTFYLTKNQSVNLSHQKMENISLMFKGEGSDQLNLVCFLADDLKSIQSNKHILSKNHNLKSPCNSISFSQLDDVLKIDLNRVGEGVDRVICAAYLLPESADKSNCMDQVSLYIQNNTDASAAMEANFEGCFTDETAFILVELYRSGGDWKIELVNQAYNGFEDVMQRLVGINETQNA